MKTKILTTALWAFFTLVGTSPLVCQENTGNYIVKTLYTQADSTAGLRREISYYDGLGRLEQTLLQDGSPTGGDLVDYHEYDSLGRTSRVWNLVSVPLGGGRQVSGGTVAALARSGYSDNRPFSETSYDGTPLEIIHKVIGPGEAWHIAGKGVTTALLTNASPQGSDPALCCVRFGLQLNGNTGLSLTHDGYWNAGTLTVQKTVDEDGRTLWVFKDMHDVTILERRLAEVDDHLPGLTVYADTYYLYDNASRLTVVLSPELSSRFSSGTWGGCIGSDPDLEQYAFQYRYDIQGRVIAKKLPGAEWTYYIYDKGGRLILSQDGHQRERGVWMFAVQDLLGRDCLKGTLRGSFDPFQSPLGEKQVLAHRQRTDEPYGPHHGYTVEGLDISANASVLSVNWWDDYAFLGREPGMSGSVFGYTTALSLEVTTPYSTSLAGGLLTGHISAALVDNEDELPGTWIRETYFYDDRGQIVQHVKSYPSDRVVKEQFAYNFSGNLTLHRQTGTDENGQFASESGRYSYDTWGRLLTTTHQVNNDAELVLSSNTYDAYGRLLSTDRGGMVSSPVPGPASLRTEYAYNVRGWLTRLSSPLFTKTLSYQTPRPGNSFPGEWGGNISSSQWSINGSAPSSYDYRYDRLGRLSNAVFTSSATVQDHSRTYSYDLNGSRSQLPETLLYDGAGNVTAVVDAQGDTVSVTDYNLYNLPEHFYNASGDSLRIIYSADGEKLFEMKKPASGQASGTEYVANYRFENDCLTMIHTDAGYYAPNETPGGVSGAEYKHVWYTRDHLGSVRLLQDGTGDVLAAYNYTPFGEEFSLTMPYTVSGAADNPYRFGGKEWNDISQSYDFEARQYSPSLGCFTSIDPLSEKYYSISPYAYCNNNPVNLVDPEGRDIYRIDRKTGYIYLMERTSHKYDQIGNYKKNGDLYLLKTNRRGQGKMLIDHIEKGILKDGMSFQESDNIIEVGGEAKPTIEGVERFLTELTDLVHKEMGGGYYSHLNNDVITDIVVGAYKNNQYRNTNHLGLSSIAKKYQESFSYKKYRLLYHTHPNDSSFSQTERETPSDKDIRFRNNHLDKYPWLRFYILTTPPFSSTQYHHEYTHYIR